PADEAPLHPQLVRHLLGRLPLGEVHPGHVVGQGVVLASRPHPPAPSVDAPCAQVCGCAHPCAKIVRLRTVAHRGRGGAPPPRRSVARGTPAPYAPSVPCVVTSPELPEQRRSTAVR